MKIFDIFLIFAQNIDCGYTLEPPLIDHICINLLVPSAQKINIENPGNQVNYWGGGG